MQQLSVSAKSLFSRLELNTTPDREFTRARLRRLRQFRPGAQNISPSVSDGFESLYSHNLMPFTVFRASGRFSPEMAMTKDY